MLHKYYAIHNMYLMDPCIFYSWHDQFYDTKMQSGPTRFALSSYLSEWNFLRSRCSFKSTVLFSRQKACKIGLQSHSWNYQTQSVHFFVVTNKTNTAVSLLYLQLTQHGSLNLQNSRHEGKWPQCHVFLSCSHQCPLIWKRKRTHPISNPLLMIPACLHGTVSFLSIFSFHLQASINLFTIGGKCVVQSITWTSILCIPCNINALSYIMWSFAVYIKK